MALGSLLSPRSSASSGTVGPSLWWALAEPFIVPRCECSPLLGLAVLCALRRGLCRTRHSGPRLALRSSVAH